MHCRYGILHVDLLQSVAYQSPIVWKPCVDRWVDDRGRRELGRKIGYLAQEFSFCQVQGSAPYRRDVLIIGSRGRSTQCLARLVYQTVITSSGTSLADGMPCIPGPIGGGVGTARSTRGRSNTRQESLASVDLPVPFGPRIATADSDKGLSQQIRGDEGPPAAL